MKFDFQEVLHNAGVWIIQSGLKIFVILILTLVAIKGCQILVDRIFKHLFKNHKDDAEIQKRADTLKSVSRNILTVTVLAVAILMVLKVLDIEIGPILAAAGVVGIAVGFGAQELIKDLINGFFILLDDQIRVGDVVQIADKGGLVESVNLRMITLRDLAGNVHFVRNGQISVVTNMTKEYSRYVFDIGVAYRENVDDVIAVIKQVDEELRNDMAFKFDILEPIEILGLDQFADSAVIIKARTKTKPIRQWAVGREFNRRLKMKFDELNIEIPFPHTTLYMGQDKDGSAPPMRLVMHQAQKTEE
jgi:small conductance mechanosensitive channel